MPPVQDSIRHSAAGGASVKGYDLRVRRVIEETPDASSIVFEVPAALESVFRYEAGQFVTLRITYAGTQLARCYSLSSSPDCNEEHKVTVKRVADGRVSNWINDSLREGNVVHVMPPGGLFTLKGGDRDLVFFAGGSGITPVISLIKSALATTSRTIRLIYANRDLASIIFRAELEALAARHPRRFTIQHHLDVDGGFLDPAGAAAHVCGHENAEFYLCGPAPFMDTVEFALRRMGVPASRTHIERFVSPPDHDAGTSEPASVNTFGDRDARSSVSVYLDGRTHDVPCERGETVLSAVQRAGLEPPFSCTDGFCGCCMAKLRAGNVRMKRNDFLSGKETSQGWVLTCQSVPLTSECSVEYPD